MNEMLHGRYPWKPLKIKRNVNSLCKLSFQNQNGSETFSIGMNTLWPYLHETHQLTIIFFGHGLN